MNLLIVILFAVSKIKALNVALGLDVEVEGEIAFNLKMPRSQDFGVRIGNGTVTEPVMKADEDMRDQVTAWPIVECLYQFPEEEQVRAILSNILNALTKVFVRAQDMVKQDLRRKGDTRFRVVDKIQTHFFEEIYSNMTDEYLKQYNTTTGRVNRTGNDTDPCQFQDEIKTIWKDLLDNSIETFRKSAIQCIDQHLKLQGKSQDEKAKTRLGQFLVRELKKVRIDQLNMLCDSFQLCFNELLE